MSTTSKIFLLILLLIQTLLALAPVLAEESFIGLFSDSGGLECGTQYTVGTMVKVYVLANLGSDIDGLRVAEFRIDNLPSFGGYPDGQIMTTWESGLSIGTIDQGIAIAFDTPQSGPLVMIGQLDFLGWDNNWLTTDHRLVVVPGLDSDQLVIVDSDYITFDVEGGIFTFNCSSESMCSCGGLKGPASWGQLKSLY